MTTDEDRREVARRLRHSWANVPDKNPVRHQLRVLFEIYSAVGLTDDDDADAIDLFARLADLIEPSEPQVKRELKYRSRCDELGAEMKRQRDALLKLADEMETADPEDLNVAIDYITECASRISEACGVRA